MTVFRLVNFEFRNPAFLILLCFAATFIYCSVNELGNSLPEQVEIIRDSFGIPHITGRDVRSASFGLGYAMAEDHHSSLTRYYRQARGEATLYYGRVYLEADFAVKQFRIYDEAKDKYKNLSELEKDIFEGFSDGLNYFLEVHPEKRNQQSYEVLPEDVLALGIYVSKLQFVYEFNQYVNQKQNYKETGSNMWAIGPGRSESGSAMLMANPHLPWNGILGWYEAHINVPGVINVYGAALMGNPVIMTGHNERIAWAHTENYPDLVDIYEITLTDENRTHYLYDGKKREIIHVIDSVAYMTQNGKRWEKGSFYRSSHGPIIGFKENKAYAVRIAGENIDKSVLQWFKMGSAGNLDEFRSAMDMQAIPKFNTCYADVDGNIYYIYGGAIPKRNGDYDWQNPVPGNISDTEWQGIIPNNELPSLLNPESGYLQNCNGAPWYTNISTGIKPEDYPELMIGEAELDMRSQMSLLLLESNKSISFDELKRYKWNSRMLLAGRIKPFLVNAALKHENFKSDIDLQKAVRALNYWDNSLGRNSRGGMLFLIWWNIYKSEAEKLYAVDWNAKKPYDTPSGIGDEAAAINALRKAVKEMENKYLSTSVPWGEIHKIKRGEIELPLSGGPGGLGVMRVIGYQIRQNNSFVGNSGDSFIMITELSSPIKSVSILPHGNSGDPKSPHYMDQMPLFSTENYKPVWFYKEDILKNMESRYHPGKEIH